MKAKISTFNRLVQVLYTPKYIFYTNTVTGLTFFGVGDYVVQRIVEHRKHSEVDFKRVGMIKELFISLHI